MLDAERQTVATAVSTLARLTPGRTGNLSVRRGDHVAITPSGVPYDRIDAADVPVVGPDGEVHGDHAPSSELPLHRACYEAFDTGAVAHAHSPWATTLAVLQEPIPPVHYMLSLAGGEVPVAAYATYGTEQLGENVVAAMTDADATACLLANHGLVAIGDDLDGAMETAVAVESVAQVYCQALAIGTPEPLPEAELDRVGRKLADYGPDGE
ncbi:class II aldolase/adducin family protein [Haloplanus aerogenes]|nr:class II aldolase/adducin family protein [Haloplanus aerogenes]AZH27160.1 class II aldolase/adducin family protein [Haloplanus aerogenes]